MIAFDFEALRAMGLTPTLARQATLRADNIPHAETLQLMRLTEVHRETVQVHDGQHVHSARALPRLQRSLANDASALTAGDWVLVALDPHGGCWVHERVPPQSHLVRRDADGRRHPVASNVDTALLVMGLDDDFSLRRLERFITLLQGTGVRPVIVLTKADVMPGARALYVRQQAVRARMPMPLDLLCVDARDADTAQRLAPFAQAGQTLVLLGSSGAGKSTLTNTLLGHQTQDTGAVRQHDSRGKHTTTTRSLFQLPGGACIIDTPGLRALRPDADAETVAATFADIASLSPQCRFRDCTHQNEPGCKVREAVDDDRLQNYHKLLREARCDTMGVLARQQLLAVWKARGRESRERLKIKRGEV